MVKTESVTHRFTLPGHKAISTEFGAFGAIPVEVTIHRDGDIAIDLKPLDKLNRFMPTLSMDQFNQLRAKIFDVTGKVV